MVNSIDMFFVYFMVFYKKSPNECPGLYIQFFDSCYLQSGIRSLAAHAVFGSIVLILFIIIMVANVE